MGQQIEQFAPGTLLRVNVLMSSAIFRAPVRCLSIVKPELIDVERDGVVTQEKWSKRPLMVTGSRDHSPRVWALPQPGAAEFRCSGPDETEVDLEEACVSEQRDYDLN